MKIAVTSLAASLLLSTEGHFFQLSAAAPAEILQVEMEAA